MNGGLGARGPGGLATPNAFLAWNKIWLDSTDEAGEIGRTVNLLLVYRFGESIRGGTILIFEHWLGQAYHYTSAAALSQIVKILSPLEVTDISSRRNSWVQTRTT